MSNGVGHFWRSIPYQALSPLSKNSLFDVILHWLLALGGTTKKPRRQYIPWQKQKLDTLALMVCYLEEDGVNQTEVARRANVTQGNIKRWINLTMLDRRAR
jgi:hypothetical protein